MRTTAATLIVCTLAIVASVVASPPVSGADRSVDDLSLQLMPLDSPASVVAAGGDAMLDLGTLSAASRTSRGRTVVVRQRVAVRLDSPSGRVASARLQAFLAVEAEGCTVRVDGVPLSTVPRLLDGVHRVGAAVVHEIELSLAASAPEGALLSQIEWLAESD